MEYGEIKFLQKLRREKFMFKIRLGNDHKDESPYLYKWGMECFGQVVEFSLSRKEFATWKEKSQKFFSGPKKVKPYLESMRTKMKERREEKKQQSEKVHTKKNATEREAVA